MLLRLTLLLACLSISTAAYAIGITDNDLDPFSSPCDLQLTQNGGTRTMTWSSINDAITYKVGRIQDGGSVETIGETTDTTFQDTTWDANECYEYVIVAYDSNNKKVCSAHVENVGSCGQE